MKRQAKIGAFMAGTLIIFAVFVFIVGDMGEFFKKRGYILNVDIESALGLEKSSDVKMAGIKIGYVENILLNQRRARVVMNIYPRFRVPKGSRATLSSLGLLGERYMEIKPGSEDSFFAPNETLEGLPAVSFDQIGNLFLSIGEEIKQTGQSLREIAGKETSDNLREALKNLSSLTAELNSFIAQRKSDVGQTIEEISQTARDMNLHFQEISENINKAAGQYGDLAHENRETLKQSLEKIKDIASKLEESVSLLNSSLEKIHKGEGTLGKLINETTLYERADDAVDSVRKVVRPFSNIQAGLELRGDYFGSSRLFRGSLGLDLWINKNKLFLGRITRDPWLNRFVYSLQGGLRWGPVVPRAGIIESEFGAGVDCYAFKDRLALGIEGFAFNRKPRPQFRIFTKYFPLKNMFIILGVEDFTLVSKREVYFGLGLGL